MDPPHRLGQPVTDDGNADPGAADELRRGWPAILACFATALFAWGFGLYGQAVLLAGLQKTRGWPTGLISAATTLYFLAGAGIIVLTPRVLARHGPRLLLGGGAALLGLGAVATAAAVEPWHIFAAALPMAAGWAFASSTAIATVLALWFDRRRGLAISLALNGASASGFIVVPILIAAERAVGLAPAVALVAGGMLALLWPLIWFGTRRDWRAPPARAAGPAWRIPGFWRVATPFAIGLVAQVALLVHMVALLTPRIGPAGAATGVALMTVMAMAGRIAAGTVAHRLPLRRLTALSFASQAASIALMAALPDAFWAQIAGCVGFGLSVGNVITLPSLIVQREFAPARFGPVVGASTAVGQVAYAFAPVLAGLAHDLAGGYGPVLAGCVALQLLAAATILLPSRTEPA